MFLTIGSKGTQVTEVQTILVRRGYNPGVIDGKYGPNTQKAVILFQKGAELKQNGIVDNQTYAALNPAPAPVLPQIDLEMKAYQIALGEIGIKDVLGPKSNNQVLKYFVKTGNSWVTDDDTSWCAAFVGYCLETAGIPSSRKLNARSYLKWGVQSKIPQLGDIVVLWRISPQSPYGHVAFFVSKDDNYVYLLGGNQTDEVRISRYPLTQVLDYRTFTNN